jgi:hypothetical protein
MTTTEEAMAQLVFDCLQFLKNFQNKNIVTYRFLCVVGSYCSCRTNMSALGLLGVFMPPCMVSLLPPCSVKVRISRWLFHVFSFPFSLQREGCRLGSLHPRGLKLAAGEGSQCQSWLRNIFVLWTFCFFLCLYITGL